MRSLELLGVVLPNGCGVHRTVHEAAAVARILLVNKEKEVFTSLLTIPDLRKRDVGVREIYVQLSAAHSPYGLNAKLKSSSMRSTAIGKIGL